MRLWALHRAVRPTAHLYRSIRDADATHTGLSSSKFVIEAFNILVLVP
jgi:hypothetical protein